MYSIKDNMQYLYFSKLYSFERVLFRDAVYSFLWQLNFEYAGFRTWYNKLFTETNHLHSGREIIVCKTDDKIIGVAILKKDEEEKKICTLRVAKHAQRNGIGKQLMLLGFEWLQTDKPLITIRNIKETQFEKLFDYFGFEKAGTYKGYYGLWGTELSYNGTLPVQESLFTRFVFADMCSFLHRQIQKGECSLEQLVDLYIREYLYRFAL